MRTWRIATNITEAAVEREEQTTRPLCGDEHGLIICAAQTFVETGVDIVAGSDEEIDETLRQVLVELDPQAEGRSGTSSSRASAAP